MRWQEALSKMGLAQTLSADGIPMNILYGGATGRTTTDSQWVSTALQRMEVVESDTLLRPQTATRGDLD